MKVTMIMVMSVDGIVVRGNEDVTEWTSKEDQEHLKSELLNYDALVTGRKSYFGKIIDKPYYILSSKEDTVKEKNVTYCRGNICQILEKIQADGHHEIALLGGPQTNYKFLKEHAVNHILLTIEPKMFGSGKHLNISETLDCNLQLEKVKKMNEKGTLLLRYNVIGNTEEEETDPSAPQPVPAICEKSLMEINKQYWNERAPLHETSEYYDLKRIVDGQSSLLDYELKELGDIKGKKLIHLQCHIGTETISLARLGARVTGLDYSQTAIGVAEKLNQDCSTDCEFICSDVYDTPDMVKGKKYDIVYVNFGAITLLPDLHKWAAIIYDILEDDGYLYLNELHPISSVLSVNEPLFVGDYFSKVPRMFIEKGSYADGVDKKLQVETENNKIIVWDRSLGEIITTIAQQGFRIEFVHEFSGYVDQRFHYQEKREDRLWYAKEGMPNTPATFSIKAVKS